MKKAQIAILIGILAVLSAVSINAQTGPFACPSTANEIKNSESYVDPIGGSCNGATLAQLSQFSISNANNKCLCELGCTNSFNFNLPKNSCTEPSNIDKFIYQLGHSPVTSLSGTAIGYFSRKQQPNPPPTIYTSAIEGFCDCRTTLVKDLVDRIKSTTKKIEDKISNNFLKGLSSQDLNSLSNDCDQLKTLTQTNPDTQKLLDDLKKKLDSSYICKTKQFSTVSKFKIKGTVTTTKQPFGYETTIEITSIEEVTSLNPKMSNIFYSDKSCSSLSINEIRPRFLGFFIAVSDLDKKFEEETERAKQPQPISKSDAIKKLSMMTEKDLEYKFLDGLNLFDVSRNEIVEAVDYYLVNINTPLDYSLYGSPFFTIEEFYKKSPEEIEKVVSSYPFNKNIYRLETKRILKSGQYETFAKTFGLKIPLQDGVLREYMEFPLKDENSEKLIDKIPCFKTSAKNIQNPGNKVGCEKKDGKVKVKIGPSKPGGTTGKLVSGESSLIKNIFDFFGSGLTGKQIGVSEPDLATHEFPEKTECTSDGKQIVLDCPKEDFVCIDRGDGNLGTDSRGFPVVTKGWNIKTGETAEITGSDFKDPYSGKFYYELPENSQAKIDWLAAIRQTSPRGFGCGDKKTFSFGRDAKTKLDQITVSNVELKPSGIDADDPTGTAFNLLKKTEAVCTPPTQKSTEPNLIKSEKELDKSTPAQKAKDLFSSLGSIPEIAKQFVKDLSKESINTLIDAYKEMVSK